MSQKEFLRSKPFRDRYTSPARLSREYEKLLRDMLNVHSVRLVHALIRDVLDLHEEEEFKTAIEL